MEKTYRQQKIYGYLTTINGDRYYLCTPQPLPKDSWQLDHQQTWSVVRCVREEALEIDDLYVPAYGQVITLITSFPTIELENRPDIWVWDGQYWEESEVEVSDQEPSEEDIKWQQLEMQFGEK